MYSDERYHYIASFNQFSLLIIDDLGIERNTEYALEQVYAVIDERYKAKLPLIITTNLTISQLRNPEDAAHARIYSRVLEMCTPVYVPGMDRRINIGKEKQEQVKKTSRESQSNRNVQDMSDHICCTSKDHLHYKQDRRNKEE